MHTKEVSIFWFRRDLRLQDNVGLSKALQSGHEVLPIFIFDTEILKNLPPDDARVTFIYQTLKKLQKELYEKHDSGLALFHGKPLEVFKTLLRTYRVHSVITNHDYEPYAIARDTEIRLFLQNEKVVFQSFKDQVIFERNEITKDDGDPYLVYTPFKNKWKEKFDFNLHLKEHATEPFFKNLLREGNLPFLSLQDLGFRTSSKQVMPYSFSSAMLNTYEETRNYPSKESGTSRLGPHLRFGTLSIRQIVSKAIAAKNHVFWDELIWREFFMQILWHFPKTVYQAFKPQYDRIVWRNDANEFEKWKQGKTGYALVDAGMRELNATGYMHNRVRMVAASFLSKHLLIDWRWGEAYFAEKLLDYDLSANVGNWQWAAGSGVDAAPYFRIFNPMTQLEKFDKNHQYISKWIPELNELTYPPKMVDHKMARERCLKAYKKALME